MLKVVLFGSGGTMPTSALKALERTQSVVAVVRPIGSRWRARAGDVARSLSLRPKDPFTEHARSKGIAVWDAQSGNDTALVENLQEVSPDVICIASFPWILHENVFSKPRLGALNVHPSLLPRHRGPNPFFWTYYHNDQQTGVTVHQVAAKLDAGDIVAQEALDVPRGVSVNILHDRVSVTGAELLAEATEALAQGNVKSRTQDVAQLTRAPKVKPGTPMTNFADWPVERVWHFLSGLCPHFIEPLQGAPYKSVTGFEEAAHSRVPGSIEKSDSGWRLFCQGGYVALSAEEKSA